jgi:RNA polymerase sigma factor (sigma-70 family)
MTVPADRSESERQFVVMYEEYADAIFRFCYFKLRDREAALELSQETFARMWRYLSGGQEIEHARAFAFRVARNAIADHVRKSRPLYAHQMGESAEHLLDPAAESGTESDAEVAGILDCLKGLPERDQEAVTLRYIESLSVSEIAESLGELPNTVSVRIKRALQTLRECVGVPPHERTS